MIRTESTTDSPEDMNRAYEAIGLEAEISTFEDGLTPKQEDAPPPEPPVADAAPEPGAPETPPAVAAEAEEALETEEDLQAALDNPETPAGVKKRVRKILAAATKLKYEAEFAAKEAGKLKEKPAEVPPPAEPAPLPPPVVEAKTKPKLEDFLNEDDPQGAFLEALTDWKSDEKIATLKAELQRDKVQETATATADAEAAEWNGAVFEAGKSHHPDWESRANDPRSKEVLFSPAFHLALGETGDPALTADIVYHLTDHPDDAKRIYELTNHKVDATPTEILRANRIVGMEMARLGHLLKRGDPAPAAAAPAPAAPATRKVTNASPPIKPVHGAAPSTAPDPYTQPQMSYRDFLKWKRDSGYKA